MNTSASIETSRSAGALAEHRLTADHHDLRRAGDAYGGADDVLKLRALHGGNVVSIPRLRGR